MAGERTAIVVLGHRSFGSDGVHRISSRCVQLVREAEGLVGAGGTELVVFTGWSSTGGLSEAEQMRDAWRGPDAELVVEPTARHTAENAARTLPLLLQRGVGRAIVVCAPSHLPRTRVIFGRLYRSSGVDVAFRAPRVAPSIRAILWELGAFPFLPLQLRAARAELARRPQ
jgi:uncharacterized SAM-binding protein YcdF (DUF218 family)